MFNCPHLSQLEEELQQRGRLGGRQTVFTHALEALLELTGAANRMRNDQPTWRLFNEVNRWVPAWRYSANLSDRPEAEEFLAAVDGVRIWVENNT